MSTMSQTINDQVAGSIWCLHMFQPFVLIATEGLQWVWTCRHLGSCFFPESLSYFQMESNSSLKRGFQVSLKSSMMVVKEWATFTSGWNVRLKKTVQGGPYIHNAVIEHWRELRLFKYSKKMPPGHFLMQPTRRHHAGCTHYSLSGDSDSLKELEEAAGKQDIWVGGAKKLQTALCLAAECRCSHRVTVWIIWMVELTAKNCWREHLGVSVCPDADKQFLDVCWIFYQASKSVTSRVRCQSYKRTQYKL